MGASCTEELEDPYQTNNSRVGWNYYDGPGGQTCVNFDGQDSPIDLELQK